LATTTTQAEREDRPQWAGPRPEPTSKWANRFIFAAIVQGAIVTALTVPIVYPWVTPAVSQVIASGSAGTWFLVGYVMYIAVGVIAVAVTALFYHHFAINLGKPFRGRLSDALAWVHLVFMNVGAGVAAGILMYGGYFGERALMPTSEGGLAEAEGLVHTTILAPLIDPAGVALIVTGIGVLAGGAGFALAYFRRTPPQLAER
jgi:hypothetical protein